MTYELDKSQYDGSVFIWSDPCLNDTDWDGYDDKKERELGSNPIVANFYIEKEDFEYITGNNYFTSSDYLNTYSNSKFESSMIWLGNNVFSSNGDKVSLYKKAIIDYIDVTLNSKKTEYEIQELLDVEKSIYEAFYDNANVAYETLKISGIKDDVHDYNMNKIKDFQIQMQRRIEDMNITYYPAFQTKEDFYKRIDEAKGEYYKLSEQVDAINTKVNLKNMKIKKIDKLMKYIGFTLDVTDTVISSREIYNDYITFKSNVSIMDDGIYLLETFKQSDNLYIRSAASDLLDIANKNYQNAIYAWEEIAIYLSKNAAHYFVTEALSKLPKFGPFVSFFFISTDFLSNATEISLYAEYTVANATIANSLCEEICKMAESGEQLKYGISISKNYKTVAKSFTDLIVLRRNAEEQYIKLNKSLPFYLEWAEKDCLEHAENNINTLNVILSKYSYIIN